MLCGLLLVWEPATFAYTASSALSRLLSYGAPAVLLLACRLAIVGLGFSAGLALWRGRAHGVALARLFFCLSLAATWVTSLTPYFPSNRPPSFTVPTLVAITAYHAAWLAYLWRSRRVARLLAGT